MAAGQFPTGVEREIQLSVYGNCAVYENVLCTIYA
jgi:hypothetical protein